jgi:hypothetical protein
VEEKKMDKKEEDNYFVTLSKIKGKVEKKANLNYISWANAWSELKKVFPESSYEVFVNEESGMPYFSDDTGAFVKVGVTVKEVSHVVFLPVTDYKNDPMKKEKYSFERYDRFKKQNVKVDVAAYDSFSINTAIQRALTKCIALHGFGLYVYQGEDLPQGESLKVSEESVKPGSFGSDVPVPNKCAKCEAEVPDVVKEYSIKHFGSVLCRKCQGHNN